MSPLEWSRGQWSRIAVAAAVLVYLPSLLNGFAYDDLPIIVQNQTVHGFSAALELLTSPYWPGERGPEFGLWRPVTSLAMALLWSLGDGAAWVFHLANLALHAGVTLVVVRLLSRLLPVTAAGLAGVVFAVHPVHVEAVANGVGLAELLAAGLGLLALDLALELDMNGWEPEESLDQGFDPDPPRRPADVRAHLPVLVLFAFAFGAKEGAIVTPGLLVLLDAFRGRLTLADLPAWLRRRGPLLLGLACVAGAMLWARSLILGSVADPLPPLGADILTEIPRIWTLGEIWAQTLRVVTVPTWLSPEYGPNVVRILTVWTPMGLLGASGLLAVLGLGWFAARRWARDPRGGAPWGGMALGIGWFIIAVSPVSNVLFVAGVLVAERTLYLPSIGVAALVGAVFAGLAVRDAGSKADSGARRPVWTRPAALGFAGLALVWSVTTITYIPKWRSHEAIFAHMVRVVPQAGRSQWVLGDLAIVRGDPDEALLRYRTALSSLGPEEAFLTETGRRLVGADMGRAALPFLGRSWEVQPKRATVAQLAAVASSQLQDWPAVELWARRALEADDADLAAWHLLAVSHAERGQWSLSRTAREALLARGSRDAWRQWSLLTEARARSGDTAGAMASADSARSRATTPNATARIDSLVIALGLGNDPPG